MVYIQTGLPELAKRYGPTLGAIAVGFGIAGFALSSWFMGRRASVVVRKPDGKRLSKIAELLESGVILPIVEDTFPLEQIADAHRAIETGRTRGKIVIDLRAG